MNTKQDDKIKIDRSLFTGIFMIIISLGVIWIATVAESVLLTNWLNNIGTGLLAAGILTIIIDYSRNIRHKKDVEEIKNAHFESMLKGMIPEPIFRQIKDHIIGEPFLRTNMSVTFRLSWYDEKKEYLNKSITGTYDITNNSQTLERYLLRANVEKVNEGRFPGSSRIESISIEPQNSTRPLHYAGEELEKYAQHSDQFARIVIPVELIPGQSIRVTAKMAWISTARDVVPFLVNKAAINLSITVSHPEDLLVRAVPLHPSEHLFKMKVDEPNLKTWSLEGGLLPFQGIQLSWEPKEIK